MDRRDPVEAAADDEADLQDVATWEPRSALDRLATGLYGLVVFVARAVVVLAALAILVVQFALGSLGAAATDPRVVALVPLSVVPALALAAYVRWSGATSRQPLRTLVATFALGVLFATFAAVVNGALGGAFRTLGVVGTALFFFLVVAPVEESVKLLAVRLHAFRTAGFDSVVDGAVYGAAAGLGFATIENYLYISRGLLSASGDGAVVGAVAGVAAVRALAGPGHVIYSGLAGYYLGLAKFNREHAGPIVVKGLLLAAFVHATYNTLVGFVPGLLAATLPGPDAPGLWFVAFVVAYDGLFGYVLYRKLHRYARAYRRAHPETTG